MASNWTIYRELTVTSFKEYARDPLPTLFSFIIPLFFILSFGITSRVASAPTDDIRVKTALIGDSDALTRAGSILEHQRGVQLIRLPVGDPQDLIDNNEAQVLIIARDGVAEPEVVSSGQMQELAAMVAGVAGIGRPAPVPANWSLRTLNEKHFNYFAFIFPSIIALALLQVSLFGTATPIVSAKERGVFKFYAVVPMPRVPLILAQISVRLVFAIIQIALLVAVGRFAFDVTLAHPLSFTLIAVLSAVLLILCGYSLAGFFRSTVLATVVLMLLNFYCMLFGQLFVDMSRMPSLNWLVLTTPVGIVSDSLRWAVLGTEGMFSPTGAVIGGLFWLAISLLSALYLFKFTPKPA